MLQKEARLGCVLSPTDSTTTLYVGGSVYETKVINSTASYINKLQFCGHEEGRIKALYNNSSSPHTLTGFAYDYMLKDHLGNVRMVLTDETKYDVYPAATLENGDLLNSGTAIYTEKEYYSIDVANIADAQTYGLPAYDNNNGIVNPNPLGNSYASSTKVYKLNSATAQRGLDYVQKVMAGDKVDILGKSYYVSGGGTTQSQLPLQALLDGFLNAPGNPAASHGYTAASAAATPSIAAKLTQFLQDPGRSSGTGPQAFINYILLDENLQYVDGNFSRIGSPGAVKDHFPDLQNIPVSKNGYLYVYCSNETDVNVFFDNLQVVHTRGPLLEETHYYPFGLTMAGISSKSAGSLGCKRKFASNELQSREFVDGSGLEFYDFNARTYDQQIGRFHQIDPMTDEGGQEKLSPYHYSYNNPVLYTDPDGKIGFIGALIGGAIGGVASLTKSVIQNGLSALTEKKTWAKAGVNAVAGAIVGATGGLGAGLLATASTSFGTSLAEDAIDGNKLDLKKAAVSSLVATATFSVAKIGADKLSKVVTKHWWNRGNTNAFMRHLGENPSTNVAQVLDRSADVIGLGNSLGIDNIFPSQKIGTTVLPGVTITGKKVAGKVKLDEKSVEKAIGQTGMQIEEALQKN